MGSRAKIILIGLSSLSLWLGCQSAPTAQDVMDERKASAHPSPATLWTDGFYATQPSSPERPVEKRDFFRNCELVRRNPFTSRSEYNCGEP